MTQSMAAVLSLFYVSQRWICVEIWNQSTEKNRAVWVKKPNMGKKWQTIKNTWIDNNSQWWSCLVGALVSYMVHHQGKSCLRCANAVLLWLEFDSLIRSKTWWVTVLFRFNFIQLDMIRYVWCENGCVSSLLLFINGSNYFLSNIHYHWCFKH